MSAGQHRRDARRRDAPHPPPAGCHQAGHRGRAPERARPCRPDRRRRQPREPHRVPAAVRRDGPPAGAGRPAGARRHASACSRSARSRARAASWSRRHTTALEGTEGFVGNVEGRDIPQGIGRRRRDRRLHRQRRAQALRGRPGRSCSARSATLNSSSCGARLGGMLATPGDSAASRQVRCRRVRRRLPARGARAGRDRPRQRRRLRDRQRDPHGRAGRPRARTLDPGRVEAGLSAGDAVASRPRRVSGAWIPRPRALVASVRVRSMQSAKGNEWTARQRSNRSRESSSTSSA